MNDALRSIPTFTKLLTVKQEKFIDQYLIDGNATQAAIRAGYSERAAGQTGHVLVKNPEIAARIEQKRRVAALAAGFTRERIMAELARVGLNNPGGAFKPDGSLKLPSEMDEDTLAAISSIETDELWEGRGEDREQVGVTRKVKFHNKVQALEVGARALGMFVEKVDVRIGIGILVIHE